MFAKDSEVVVAAIGRTGRVVEVGHGGRYRVRVGAVVMACREEELAPVPERRGGKAKARKRRSEGGPVEKARGTPEGTARASETKRLGSLDLHGLTVEEALGTTEKHLDRAIRAGLDRVDIVHGRGTGRVKHALHRYLADLSVVRHFEVAPDNPGVTRVFF